MSTPNSIDTSNSDAPSAGSRIRRQIASILALVFAGLATIATSVPLDQVTFNSTGHVLVSDDQPGGVNVHVEVAASQASKVERVYVRLSSGVSSGGTGPFVADLSSSSGANVDASQSVPASWELGNPECTPGESCVRDYQIAIRSVGPLPRPALVPWSVTISMQYVSSYDQVYVVIDSPTPAPTPGMLGLLAAATGAGLALLTVTIAAWKAGDRRRLLGMAGFAVVVVTGVFGIAIFVAALPETSGSAVVLLVAAALVLTIAWRHRRPTNAPRIDLLLITLPVGAIVLTAYQIAPSVTPQEVLLGDFAIGLAVGVGIARFARPGWWRSRLHGWRERLAAVLVVALVLLIVSGAAFAAATATNRDPTPLLLVLIAIGLLGLVRRWARTTTLLLQIFAGLLVILCLGIAWVTEHFGPGLFQSVPLPSSGTSGQQLYVAAVAVLSGIVAVAAGSRTSTTEHAASPQPAGELGD